MLTERAVEVPGPVRMAGILTEPPGGARPGRVGVLLLNAGHLHRVGPGRLHVDLARRLARVGIAALRLDAPGVGESRERQDTLGDARADALGDVGRALDAMTTWLPTDRFVLFGLCSGGELAVDAGANDPRVAGVIALEGYAFPTPKFLARRYLPRLVRPDAWVNRLRDLASRAASRESTDNDDDDDAVSQNRTFPQREDVAARLRTFMARDGHLLAVFAGGPWHYVQYEGQFRDCFADVPFGDRLTVLHEPTADHLFTDLAIRERVVRRCVGFVQGVGDAPGTASLPSDPFPDTRRLA